MDNKRGKRIFEITEKRHHERNNASFTFHVLSAFLYNKCNFEKYFKYVSRGIVNDLNLQRNNTVEPFGGLKTKIDDPSRLRINMSVIYCWMRTCYSFIPLSLLPFSSSPSPSHPPSLFFICSKSIHAPTVFPRIDKQVKKGDGCFEIINTHVIALMSFWFSTRDESRDKVANTQETREAGAH